MNELSIQYQNFHPSTFTKEYLGAKLGHILNRAPAGSTVKAVFAVENGGITATLRIMSSAGEFFAISKGRFLKDVNRRLLVQIRRQLQRWNQRARVA
jgi:hypothetical protein